MSQTARLAAATLMIGLLALDAGEVRGQAPLAVQARAGVLIPLAGFRDGLDGTGRNGAGASFGIAFTLERPGGWYLYGGFSQHRVDCSSEECVGAGEHVSTAWDLGARRDFGSGAAVPWIRAGVTIPRVELAGGATREEAVTDLGIGGEAGAGIRFGVGGRFHITPAVRLGAVDAGRPVGPAFRMRYLVADLGVVIGF